MSMPTVFISSTFYDLRYIRNSLEYFIRNIGYDAILSEKGRIAYDPDMPLDESCYREAASADIFVLIIGGRYGSASSDQMGGVDRAFYERYESITKKEYAAAAAEDLPIYIVIENSVYHEYETYRLNKGNSSIEYAHVDSENIFIFIDEIISRSRNNPIFKFNDYQEIEGWLKGQWAGLFKEYINKRSSQKQMLKLSEKVAELSSLHSSIQRYMEELVSRVSESPEEAKNFINVEKERLENEVKIVKFSGHPYIAQLAKAFNLSSERVYEIGTTALSVCDFIEKINSAHEKPVGVSIEKNFWREHNEYPKKLNDALVMAGFPELKFE
jgi:hypothetical protein